MEVVRLKTTEERIEILRKDTLAALTGGTGRANAETLAALERGLETARGSAEPQGGYRYGKITEVTRTEANTLFGPVESTRFALMARRSSGEKQVVFTLSTLGEAVDEAIAGDIPLLDKFVLDAVASELAEMVAGLVEERWLQEVGAAGREASARMSPGYCDWLIRGQSVVFRALDAAALGVRLTDSFLMIPSKSVSSAAVVADEVPLKVQCLACGRKDCQFRRAATDDAWSAELAG